MDQDGDISLVLPCQGSTREGFTDQSWCHFYQSSTVASCLPGCCLQQKIGLILSLSKSGIHVKKKKNSQFIRDGIDYIFCFYPSRVPFPGYVFRIYFFFFFLSWLTNQILSISMHLTHLYILVSSPTLPPQTYWTYNRDVARPLLLLLILYYVLTY